MARKRRSNKPRRIAIAIELDQPYRHHYDSCRGILQYAAERGWQTVIDPHLVGMTGQGGVSEYDGIVGRITRRAAEEAGARGIPVVNHWINSRAKGSRQTSKASPRRLPASASKRINGWRG